MICRRIRYKNFRNLESAELCPSENVTVLNGENGQGKTNTLEGVYLIAGGRSFRTVHENELIRFGEDVAEISMDYFDGRRENNVVLRFVLDTGKRFCRRNGVPITKLSELVGGFRAVLFCPAHLSIVRDGPAIRRKFMDSAISQINPSYLRALQKYNSLLEQRNALIKMSRDRRDDKIFYDTADIWSEQLAAEAEIISRERLQYMENVNVLAGEIVSDMTSGREKVTLSYQSARTKEEYFALLTENRERELRAGITLYGTHKDDIKIDLNGADARSFGSQGQQRSIALAMKIAEGEVSKQITGEYPVFLFDDILSELDTPRRDYLLSGIKDKQVIITSCDKIETEAKVYIVSSGKVTLRQ